MCDRSSLYWRSVTSQFLLNLQDARRSSPLHLLVSMKSAPDHRSFDCSFCLYHIAVTPNPWARSTTRRKIKRRQHFLFKCLKCAFSLWVQKKSANLAVKSWNALKPAHVFTANTAIVQIMWNWPFFLYFTVFEFGLKYIMFTNNQMNYCLIELVFVFCSLFSLDHMSNLNNANFHIISGGSVWSYV